MSCLHLRDSEAVAPAYLFLLLWHSAHLPRIHQGLPVCSLRHTEAAPTTVLELVLISEAEFATAVGEADLATVLVVLEVEAHALVRVRAGSAAKASLSFGCEALESLLLRSQVRGRLAETVVDKGGGMGPSIEHRQERLLALQIGTSMSISVSGLQRGFRSERT